MSDRTFSYVQKLDGFYEVSEADILAWTQLLTHLLKVTIEPTSALGMAAAHQWIGEGNRGKKILVILSGGNMDAYTRSLVWKNEISLEF